MPGRLGDFEILREIGRGGMGTVYEARQVSLDRTVALKMLPPEAAADPERLHRFTREARALAAAEHPNIVAIHAVEHIGGCHFIAMEHVRGQPLSDLVPSGGFPVGRFLDLAVQLADAMAAAHLRGVVHRDLKPANIMVAEGGRLKVLDFGLARLGEAHEGDEEAASRAVTRTELVTGRQVLGTLPYMSPEQIQGRPADCRSDVFSLGVVLHEMATGQRPFSGDSPAALISSILRDAPPPLADARADLPGEAGRIVGRALEKSPEHRYQTATDLRNDLEELRNAVVSRDQAQVDTPKTDSGAGPSWWVWLAAAAVLVVLAGVAAYLGTGRPARPDQAAPSIIVLPFDNLGPAEDEYFAGGLTEEIASRLAAVGGLRVKSSATARHYDRAGKSSQTIGKELDVAYFLHGSLRWDRAPGGQDRVRITPHLVRVSDDTDVWARTFDRVIADAFAVQSEIAAAVVASLGVALQGRERDRLEVAPTEDHEAYLAYLRGRYFEAQPHFGRNAWKEAMESYEQAVQLDEGFALAWAHLAKAHARWYYLKEDTSDEQHGRARHALERALALAPDAPEVHLAAGYYHLWADRNGDRALEWFERAATELPDNAEAGAAKAGLLRVRGRYEEALDRYRNAFELNPRDVVIAEELVATCWYLRRYPEALQYSDRAIALAPKQAWPYLHKAFNYWSWKGAAAESRDALTFVSKEHEWWLWAWFWQEVSEGRHREALRLIDEYPGDWVRQKMWAMPKAHLAGMAHTFLGDAGLARAEFERARTALVAEVAAHPDDPRYHSSLGIVCAALGLRDDALRHGTRAVELLPIEKDAEYGLPPVHDLAVVYTLIGDESAALGQIERLLSIPSWVSPAFLRSNPMWRPLHGRPGFEALLKKFGG